MCVALCVCVALRAKRGVAAVRCAAGDCARGKRRHKTDVLSREWRERRAIHTSLARELLLAQNWLGRKPQPRVDGDDKAASDPIVLSRLRAAINSGNVGGNPLVSGSEPSRLRRLGSLLYLGVVHTGPTEGGALRSISADGVGVFCWGGRQPTGSTIAPRCVADIRIFSETSRAAGYSHLGSVVWAEQGSVGFTPGAGRGSGRAVVRQCSGRAARHGMAGLRFGWGRHDCRAEIWDLRW